MNEQLSLRRYRRDCLLVTALRADHRKLPPENATEVPESESSDLAWASGRIAAGMEWILLFPR